MKCNKSLRIHVTPGDHLNDISLILLEFTIPEKNQGRKIRGKIMNRDFKVVVTFAFGWD